MEELIWRDLRSSSLTGVFAHAAVRATQMRYHADVRWLASVTAAEPGAQPLCVDGLVLVIDGVEV